MQKMREMNVEKKFVNYLKFMNGRIPAIDQGVINSVLKGYIGVVSPKYNFIFSRHSISRSIYKIDYEYLMKKTKIANYYDESVVKEANENPIVVHFMYGDKRPWVDGNIHPVFHEEYMLFRGMTPWAKFPLKKPKKINIIKKYIKKYLDILPKKVYVQYFTLRRFIFYIKLYIYSRIRTITSEIRIEDCRIVESRSEN
jgi:lipopolysaccharide biosynthesis glycosyltransferase